MGTDIHIAVEIFRDGGWHLSDAEVTEDRNYRAFAVLADVRNGYGFGGFSTGEALMPIDEPRGLPDDLSPELRRAAPESSSDDYSNHVWLGDHSFSWVTLKELLDYDLDEPVIVQGYVSKEEARHYRETGEKPRSYAAAVFANLENFEYLKWPEPIRESAWLIPKLIEELTPLGEPDNVRIVFGFDS